MYTLTIIRINNITNVLENTEVNGIFLAGQIEKELANHNASFDQVQKFLDMKKGESTIIQINYETNKIWIYYISKLG